MIVDTNWPPLTVFAPLLSAVDALVVGYGILLRVLTSRQVRKTARYGPRPARTSTRAGVTASVAD
ncbi:hypothetical protein [Mycobacterium gastri]|uniref:Uncharacterized protein n=1 Tax=Mycobacterium gastri TaxID=1777 RepID=A0A1X1VK99_MYCGS|nr:hypothetical protein [Mycobacterium gastri]ETW21144.1 hypothetical protein MGAST_27870 [Mycobacterium gastri 'Wayne']ORV69437.1 hypothetical protein AWC07_00495 [Mycobacterium gastri]